MKPELPDLVEGDWVRIADEWPCARRHGRVIEVLNHGRYVVRLDEPVSLGGASFTDVTWGREQLVGPIRLVDRIAGLSDS